MTLYELSSVTRSYPGEVEALDNVDMSVERGEYVALMGPSGSGKTTLLNLLGLIDTPTTGTISFEGVDTATWTDRERTNRRAVAISFIFQAFHLFSDRTVWENIEIGLIHQGVTERERTGRVQAAISAVGLEPRSGSYARTLSGGEQQRVSIARAIARDTGVLLCDEPVGNLDSQNASRVLGAIDGFHKRNVTVIMVTHDQTTANRADRIIRLGHGQVEG